MRPKVEIRKRWKTGWKVQSNLSTQINWKVMQSPEQFREIILCLYIAQLGSSIILGLKWYFLCVSHSFWENLINSVKCHSLYQNNLSYLQILRLAVWAQRSVWICEDRGPYLQKDSHRKHEHFLLNDRYISTLTFYIFLILKDSFKVNMRLTIYFCRMKIIEQLVRITWESR